MKFFAILVTANILFSATAVYAQQAGVGNPDDLEVINIENLYKNNPPPTPPVPVGERAAPAPQVPADTTPSAPPNLQSSTMRNLTDLNKLAPFSDISVIQKKYLPKTGRFQLFAAGGLTTNSPWFLNLGARLNFGYNFSESFGLELTGLFLTNSELDSAKNIRQNNNLQPDKFVVTKSHIGLDLVWAPIYGKMSTLDNKIIPFDMYFSIGGGTSNTTAQEGNVPTYHLGTGQIFAISKSTAFRWDYSWNFYQATPTQDAASTTAPSKGSYNDLILTLGMSFFFPEASYR